MQDYKGFEKIIMDSEQQLETNLFIRINFCSFSFRAGLPKEVVNATNRENHSYEVYWDASNRVINLHSYVCVTKSKGSKNVLLLSTVEPILGTTKGCKDKRPAAIELYNFSKGGTDIGRSNFYCIFSLNEILDVDLVAKL